MAENKKGGTYYPYLDGLRCVAVSWVLLFHLQLYFKFPASGAFGLLASRGWMGVDIFFVISGFLITSILLREQAGTGRISLPKFYMRRALRIWPVYYLVVGATFAVALAVGDQKVLDLIKWPAMYLTDLYAAYGNTESCPLLHSWSLAVEEQFYLLWPLLLFWNIKWSKRIAIAAIIAIAIWRTWLTIHLPVGVIAMRRTYYAPDTRMDQVLYGAVLAFIVLRNRSMLEKIVRSRVTQAASIIVFLTAVYINSRWSGQLGNAIGYSMTGLSVAIGIAYLLIVRPVRVLSVLECKPMAYIGKISYGIYLFSPLVIELVKYELPHTTVAEKVLACALVCGASISVAAISYAYFESPFLRLKERFSARISSSRMSPAAEGMAAVRSS